MMECLGHGHRFSEFIEHISVRFDDSHIFQDLFRVAKVSDSVSVIIEKFIQKNDLVCPKGGFNGEMIVLARGTVQKTNVSFFEKIS